ncbi:hypothetical protein PISMIDRAFT_682999 [Pisolithus microcarpus 441]|uniref:Uncharacterized protein n=1 Tax=Pisolithus microcarpus 441 TaxID=765257 RepID=A0A0C9ZAP5_9AGAM|nr:hypothetical protein PISMIDRAFT_682999 [Pisolithus microcarpus 441]
MTRVWCVCCLYKVINIIGCERLFGFAIVPGDENRRQPNLISQAPKDKSNSKLFAIEDEDFASSTR